MPLVAVCVASYQRPQYLRGLLDSMRRIQIDGFRAHLIIADNDMAQTAEPVVVEVAAEFPIPVTYVVEPTRGIASARNRLVQTAETIGAEYVAFVDDDQFVEPDWLRELVSVATATNVDAVTGRWVPCYEDGVPEWARRSGFMDDYGSASNPLLGTGAPADDFGTSNVLIKLDSMLQVPGPFDERQNLTGGSDVLFFDDFHRRGFISIRCDESIVYERRPASRATSGWIIKRRFRYGLDAARRHRRSAPSLRRNLGFLFGTLARVVKHAVLLVPDLFRGRASVTVRLARLAHAGGRVVGLTSITYKEYQRIHGK